MSDIKKRGNPNWTKKEMASNPRQFAPAKSKGKVTTGAELAAYLKAKNWTAYDAASNLHIPWTEFNACIAWPKQKIPEKMTESIEKYN